MIDSFKITKLNEGERINSHLIQIGSFNILCDIPLDPHVILKLKNKKEQQTEGKKKHTKKDKSKNGKEKYQDQEKEEDVCQEENISKKLLLDISKLPLKIHIIIISCVEGFVGLPILCKLLDLEETQIICTKPTYNFAMAVIDNLQEEHYLPPWKEDFNENIIFDDSIFKDKQKNTNYFDMKLNYKNTLHLLSYKENISFKNEDETINVTLCSSGYSLGSSNFFIETTLMNMFIINKSSYNIKRYPSDLDLSFLKKTHYVLITSYRPYISASTMNLPKKEDDEEEKKEKEKKKKINQTNSNNNNNNTGEDEQTCTRHVLSEKIKIYEEKSYKENLNKICALILETVKKRGTVLIPVDIYFSYFIEIIELTGVIISKYLTKEEQVLIFGIMPNINDIIHYASLCAEWVEDSRKKKCYKIGDPTGPFSFEIMKDNNRLFIANNIHEISPLFRFPCVCFVQDSTLRFSDAASFFEKWSDQENSSMLLIDANYNIDDVLSPFNFKNKSMNILHCPLSWELNELQILQILQNNENAESVYLLPYEMKRFFEKNGGFTVQVKEESESIPSELEDKSQFEKENKEIIDLQFIHSFINTNRIRFIDSFKTEQIVVNHFDEFKRKMRPIRFYISEKKKLEQILQKVNESSYCANVEGKITNSIMGTFINANSLKKIKEEPLDESENDTDDKYPQIMIGPVKPEQIVQELLKLGYSKKEIELKKNKKEKKEIIEEDAYLWCIYIKHLNSQIKAYSSYDIEISTSHSIVREQMKQILSSLTMSL